MDEAHKTVGAKDRLFSHLLYDRNLPIHRRIFMTATERRYQGEGDDILSMDDPEVYGDTFHLLTFKRALEYRPPILSDYKIVTILVSRDEVADLIRKNVFVRPDKGRWNKEVEAEMLAGLVALRKAMQKYPIRHTVSFHSSIRRAEVFKAHNDAFTQAFPAYGRVSTFHVSGQTPTGTRARIVKEFAETERGLITNARCLTEGVDVPDIDCVMFADPRRSAVDIVQAVGRALRPASGKKMGYVIVPILHAADAKPEDILESNDFQEVLATLRALAANDDRIIEYFRAISEGKRHTGGGSVEFDLDERIAKHINLAQFARDIDLKCWDRLARLSWRQFLEARTFAQNLNLRSLAEWFAFSKGTMPNKSKLPRDIPVCPNEYYAGKGWKNWGDWLGTGTVAGFLRHYRPFHEARAYVRRLKLTSRKEWAKLCKGKLPSKPKLPPDIPAAPYGIYAGKGWKGWGDWLGTGFIANYLRRYRPFHEARAYVRRLKLRSGSEWEAFCDGKLRGKGRLPIDIPAAPWGSYADKGWKGMGDWLGTGNVASYLREYKQFREARRFARGLELKNQSEWFAFSKGQMPERGELPADIPATPDKTYADKGWKGYGDWLGTGNVAPTQRVYRGFRRARSFVHALHLHSNKEWRLYCAGKLRGKGRLPSDIPSNPNLVYLHSGWTVFGDWLGTGTISWRSRSYIKFEDARAFVHKLKLKNHTAWRMYCTGKLVYVGTRPKDIPSCPRSVYAGKGWRGFGDWLGTGAIAPCMHRYRRFEDARVFARSLRLKSSTEWRYYCRGEMPDRGKRPSDIPACPDKTYTDKGWKGYSDWLGTSRAMNRRTSESPTT